MIYKFESFEIDSSQRLLMRNDIPVPLSLKAADLLVTLLEHAGQVVTKDELFQAVWPNVFVGNACLTQNIFTVRKALGDEARSNKFIETVDRRGYRFVAKVETSNGVKHMPDGELTVEEALKELREMWPEGSFQIIASSGLPRYRILVLRYPHLSVHRPIVEGSTLIEAMAQVRAWHKAQSNKQSQESK